MLVDITPELGLNYEGVHTSEALPTEKGSNRLRWTSWKKDLTRLGLVVGGMTVGAVVISGPAMLLTLYGTESMGPVFLDSRGTLSDRGIILFGVAFISTVVGMAGGMELGARLTGLRTKR